MATPSPLNWNQRNRSVPSLRFATAEDFARHMTAKTAGPTGMHQRDTIQSGPHKGKTPSQVAAEYMEISGLPSRTTRTMSMPSLGAMPSPSGSAPVVPDISAIDPGMVYQPRKLAMPSITAPPSLLATIQPPGAPAPVTPAAKGGVLTMPGSRRSPGAMGSTSRPVTFEGVSAEQFGQQAAARQNTGNAFTGYTVPSREDPFKTAPAAPSPQVTSAPQSPAPPAPAPSPAAPSTPAAPPALRPPAPMNGMNIMTPEVARAAKAADAAQNPTPVAPASPGRVTTLNGRPYKSPLAADMGLPQPGQPSSAPAAPAAPAAPKPSGAFYARNYVPGSLKPPMLLAGARAAGGPVQGGQPYLVGEQGPEIIVPRQSGTVIPNHQLPAGRMATPRKPARPAPTVIPIKPPSLLSTFG